MRDLVYNQNPPKLSKVKLFVLVLGLNLNTCPEDYLYLYNSPLSLGSKKKTRVWLDILTFLKGRHLTL